MNTHRVEGRTLPEAYHNALKCLRLWGIVAEDEEHRTKVKEITATIQVQNPLKEPRISRMWPGGPYDLQRYKMEMVDGILDFLVDAAPNLWPYTYHQRIGEQLKWCIEELKSNPTSRRAVIAVRDPEKDMSNESPACLQTIGFYIRDEELHMKVLFRSNDAVKAFFMNAFALISIQEVVAEAVGRPVGTYEHTAWSFHSYEDDWNTLENYVNRISAGDTSCREETTSYNYEGFYRDFMEAEISNINKLVLAMERKYKK